MRARIRYWDYQRVREDEIVGEVVFGPVTCKVTRDDGSWKLIKKRQIRHFETHPAAKG